MASFWKSTGACGPQSEGTDSTAANSGSNKDYDLLVWEDQAKSALRKLVLCYNTKFVFQPLLVSRRLCRQRFAIALLILYNIQKFYDEGVFPPGIVGEQGINVIDSLFTEGKAAAVISGPWNLAPFQEAGIDFGVQELPLLASVAPCKKKPLTNVSFGLT